MTRKELELEGRRDHRHGLVKRAACICNELDDFLMMMLDKTLPKHLLAAAHPECQQHGRCNSISRMAEGCKVIGDVNDEYSDSSSGGSDG